MKIKRVPKGKWKKFVGTDNILMNIFFFFYLYWHISLAILGIAFSAFLTLLVLDLLAPKTLRNLDTKATLELFDQLQEANRHREAIVLMEYKGDVMNNSPLELEYKTKLSDSYIHVGDYSKAEKMLLDVWANSDKYLSELTERDVPNHEQFCNIFKFGLARNIYQFYERIGDKKNQIRYYLIYKGFYDKCGDKIDSLSIDIYNSKTWFKQKTTLNSRELIEYDSIVVTYETDKDEAIAAMRNYTDKIINRKEYGPSFKVKCLNKLIGWYLKDDKAILAYPRVSQAIQQVKLMKFTGEYVGLGELSDYCFILHDIELSKSLYNRYQDYLEDNYNKDDFEYLSNYVRKFRLLEEDNELDRLSSEVWDYCIGMRKQIALNIPTMTEEQREYFAKLFDVAHYYALDLLQKHPSDKLATLCFDNITFKSGLLLRSNLSLRHSVESMNNPELTKLYDDLYNLRRDLVFEEVVGKRILSKKGDITDRIAQVEKVLALKCTDFKTKNELTECSITDIQSKMAKSEAFIDFAEYNGNLFALVLRAKGDVQYVPIGGIEEIKDILQKPIHEVYHDKDLTALLWGKVEPMVEGCSTIYYMPIGQFNQISLGALYIGDNKYLCDVKNIRLLSSPSIITRGVPNITLDSEQNFIALWGGIPYGDNTAIITGSNKVKRSAIRRGEKLHDLRYAYREVQDISTILSNSHIKNITYTNEKATEAAFKGRSGKKDYIIHVSTHGFFDDASSSSNSMLNSGLFFAGANKYWTNDSLELHLGQEDGILRSAEISTLNLSGCSLAVLSACETGLGYNDSSEGVYGLQRAFKLAGANIILMSLWDVDDRATNLLMTEFYKNLLVRKDAQQALLESQLTVRKKYPSPGDWGGFVLLY